MAVPRETPLANVLAKLPLKVRFRAYCITVGAITVVVLFGLWHAPTTTVAGTSGLSFMAWIRSLVANWPGK